MFDISTNALIVGMVHLPPLPGHDGWQGLEYVKECAIYDAVTLAEGGVDAVMIENNYDLPHTINVSNSVYQVFAAVAAAVRLKVRLPIGFCVLWNDYTSSFKLAKDFGGSFIRVPCLVDDVRTSYGDVYADPSAVIRERDRLSAQDIKILADIHVKHSKLLSSHTLVESAHLAFKQQASAVVITGNWTSDFPAESDLALVRSALTDKPIVIGSGARADNVDLIHKFKASVIVGTALKEGENSSAKDEINIKKHTQRISLSRTQEFVQRFRGKAY